MVFKNIKFFRILAESMNDQKLNTNSDKTIQDENKAQPYIISKEETLKKNLKSTDQLEDIQLFKNTILNVINSKQFQNVLENNLAEFENLSKDLSGKVVSNKEFIMKIANIFYNYTKN